jgi:chromosomal replication initiation ATPase DnaA
MNQKQTMANLHLAVCVRGNATSEIYISDQIASLIKLFLGIEKQDLFSKNRKREIALGRHLYRYLLRIYLPVEKNSLNLIGQLSNSDHSTVIHSIRQIRNLFSCTDDFSLAYSEKFTNIENKLKEMLTYARS